MYIYNPCEPQGVPVQPGPNILDPHIQLRTDAQSFGRCGNCAACPKIWHLNAPVFEFSLEYGGDYYLKRNPYRFAGGHAYENCSWDSGLAWGPNRCPLNGVNPFVGADQHGWLLTFEYLEEYSRLTWYLFTPLTFDGEAYHQSVYHFVPQLSNWRCLRENEFHYLDRVQEFDFPFIPDRLVLTPFYL